MINRYLFDEDVLNYDKRRPVYSTELCSDVVKFTKLDSSMNTIEIGCGTGQATKPFLDIGCDITAIELGENLSKYTRDKYHDYKNLEVICSSFEDYLCTPLSYDFAYSATAFHWVEQESGYAKLFEILKSGGSIAMFWNIPSININLTKEIRNIYNQYVPEWKSKDENKKKTYSSCVEWIVKSGFIDVEVKTYNNTRDLKASEYIDLLNTYSDHRGLDDEVKRKLYQGISEVIVNNDNSIVIDDYIELYLARKP